MNNKSYRICERCVMDTSDPNIKFSDNGHCDYCENFESQIMPEWKKGVARESELQRNANEIIKQGKNKEFDCIIGLSGGLDSSYAAYVAKVKMGLRPLLFHVDAGWNTEQAVKNIEKLVDGLGLDLYTEVINWEEMKDLQVAFLKAQIPDQDLPQDAAFFSNLYNFARKMKIKTIITGSNYSTECCREPEEWGGYLGIDKTLFKSIHKKFGTRKLNDFLLIDILQYKFFYKIFGGMKVVMPLNMVPFVKKDAEAELEKLFDWKPFLHKHHESRFTRFYEDYWLPRKFGYDKRRAHFSSLILTGQMSRNEGLQRLTHSELDEKFLMQEFHYVASKLDLSPDELQSIFTGPNKTFRNYPNKRNIILFGASLLRMLGLEKRLFR